MTTTQQHYHKRVRTQIITQQIGTETVPLFGQFKTDEKGLVILDKEGNKVNKTWNKPILKVKVIHHKR